MVIGLAALVLVRVALFVLTRPHSILLSELTLLGVNWQLAVSVLSGIVATIAILRARAARARSLMAIAVLGVVVTSSAYFYVFYTPVRDQAIPDLWVK